jgi:hypothetical protein
MPFFRKSAKLVGEACLADSRLAGDQEETSVPGHRLLEARLQLG